MTSQKLYEILTFLDALDRKLDFQTKLEAVKTSLTNLVNQPAQPQYQSALASALAAFEQAAAQLGELIASSQYAVVEGMGGEDFFDSSIAEKIKNSVQMNAMTPSVAKDFVEQLATRRAEFLTTVRSARLSLEKLKITASALEPGSADLAFLIPRDIFDNELAQFAKELIFISRLLQDFSEALTGKAEHVQLEQLSSSIPTVALAASVPVIGVIAVVVNKFLEAWEKIERIRKIRAELTEIGMRKAALDEIEETITTTVDEVVEASVELVLVKYQGAPERRNELANGIRQDTRRLFGQIERGLKVEFRAEPKKDGDAEDRKALTDICDLARVMQFPQVAPEPMLLKGGEILEGDIQGVKQSKKTTTHKTTVSKKGAPKDGGGTE
jgi:hypothetical protein